MARDLPFLMDHFRPQDGHLPLLNKFITSSVEGRARLDRASESKAQAEISSLPIVTGEDFPEGDAGLLGRVLVIDFTSNKLRDILLEMTQTARATQTIFLSPWRLFPNVWVGSFVCNG